MLLALAEHGDFTAYELIAELERLFAPAYKPSPGGVYPAIAALTAEKLLRARQDGRGKRYALTADGRAALEKRRRQLAAIEERTGARVRQDDSLLPMLERFVDRVMKVSGLVEPAVVEAALEKTAQRIEATRAKSGGRNGRR